MEKRFNFKKAEAEATKIQDMVGPHHQTSEKYTQASDHLDNVRTFTKAGWKPEKRPTEKEIKKFTVTPEMWAEALNRYDEDPSELVNAAAFSQRNGVSYRDFKVGCAVAGIGPKVPPGEYIVWQAYNATLTSGPHTGKNKRCAERNALESARTDCKVVFGIASSSQETSTGDATEAHDVLHPCRECRDNFRDLLREGFLREDTRISSGNNAPGNDIIRTITLKELLDLYQNDK